MTRVDSHQMVIHNLYPRLNYGALIFWPFLSATAIYATVASRRMHHLYSCVISNSIAELMIYLMHPLFFYRKHSWHSCQLYDTHIYGYATHFFSRKTSSLRFTSSWSFWQLIGTLVPPSSYSQVYRFYQSSSCVQFRTHVRSRESVPKELKSKGILA